MLAHGALAAHRTSAPPLPTARPRRRQLSRRAAAAALVQDSERVSVTLKRPLGLVLGERDGGDGVFVDGLTPGGNAEACGKVELGDWLVAVDGADVAYASFDEALDALAAGAPAPATLELERTVFANVDVDAQSAAATYWDAKRAAKARGAPPPPRNTVAGLRSAKDVRLRGGALGGGSFGAVFEAEWAGRALVAKRANERVVGAAESLETELLLNELAAAAAPGACAAFLGALDVTPKEGGQLYDNRLNAGLWLLFVLESRSSLASLLAKADADARVAAALALPPGARRADIVAATGARLLAALAALHGAGIVHRDVKPANVLVCSDPAALRLIDLGAGASCLTPPVVNYAPGIGACDPLYCEPGDADWALPAEADAPAEDGSNLAQLWATYRPDGVDVYAAAVTLLQLALPPMRSDAALRTFRAQLAESGGDLRMWREAHGARTLRGFDEDASLGATGWAALAAMMAPRQRRVSAAEAAALPFFARR